MIDSGKFRSRSRSEGRSSFRFQTIGLKIAARRMRQGLNGPFRTEAIGDRACACSRRLRPSSRRCRKELCDRRAACSSARCSVSNIQLQFPGEVSPVQKLEVGDRSLFLATVGTERSCPATGVQSGVDLISIECGGTCLDELEARRRIAAHQSFDKILDWLPVFILGGQRNLDQRPG